MFLAFFSEQMCEIDGIIVDYLFENQNYENHRCKAAIMEIEEKPRHLQRGFQQPAGAVRRSRSRPQIVLFENCWRPLRHEF